MKANLKTKINTIINLIHFAFICIAFGLTFRAIICVDTGVYSGKFWSDLYVACTKIGLSEIYTFFGALAIVMFGIIGIYDFAYQNGIPYLVPPLFASIKERTYIKQAEKMMKTYYNRDINFIKEYEKERTGYILQTMGIDEAQFHAIKYEIVKARVMPEQSIAQLQDKIKKLLLDGYYIMDLSNISRDHRVYDKVDYYLNLYLAAYDTELCFDISRIMCRFILLHLKEKIDDIDYIIVPIGSNSLLGLEIGKILRKKTILIFDEERIERGRYWDSEYITNGKKNNVIIIHDVLVTGKRIWESLEKLPNNTYQLMGLFCVAEYTDTPYNPKDNLKNHGITSVNSIIEIDERLLKSKKVDSYD